MTNTRKPIVKKGPASHYAGPGESIYEFSDGESGGLLSLRRNKLGILRVEIYRTDADVMVIVPAGQAVVFAVFDPDAGSDTCEDNPGICHSCEENPIDYTAPNGLCADCADDTSHDVTPEAHAWHDALMFGAVDAVSSAIPAPYGAATGYPYEPLAAPARIPGVCAVCGRFTWYGHDHGQV